MVSPSFTFNCPPPPPYSQTHSSSTNASPAGLPPPNNLISPPGSRRTSGADQSLPPPPPAPRQSLPSILEALGGPDHALAYPSQQQGPPSTAPGPAFFQTTATSSADIHRRPIFTSGPSDPPRTAGMHPSIESNRSRDLHRPAELHRPSFTQIPPPQSPYMSRPPPQQGHGPPTPTSQTHSDGRAPYQPQHPRLPSLHPIRTGNSPVTTPRNLGYPPSQQPSPGYETTPQSAPSAPYSYPQYGPPSYQYPAATSGPVYTPSAVSVAPPRYPQSQQAWPPGHDYHNGIDERGETVKRHLDSFELEASLNEVNIVFNVYLQR